MGRVFYHHGCLHENDLMPLGKVSDTELQVYCPECGMTWVVDLSTGIEWDVAPSKTILYTVDYNRRKDRIIAALEGLK